MKHCENPECLICKPEASLLIEPSVTPVVPAQESPPPLPLLPGGYARVDGSSIPVPPLSREIVDRIHRAVLADDLNSLNSPWMTWHSYLSELCYSHETLRRKLEAAEERHETDEA